jgi:sugar phosphate isomerase/epimerase
MPWTLSAFADEAAPATDDQIAALQAAGIDRIDPRSVDGHNITELPLDLAEQVQRKYHAAGITVNMFGSPIGKIDLADDIAVDLARLEHLGKLKDIFGCTAVRIFSYFNRAGAAKDLWRTEALDRLRQLADAADRLGLVLYHENESDIFGDHSDDVLAIAELRDGRTFMLIYDFANYLRTGEAGAATWAKLKDKTDCFHLKDQKTGGEHVPIGQGDTGATAILKDAADAGWIGGCTVEPHLRHGGAVRATGARGTGMQNLAELTDAQCFQLAADQAVKLLGELGVR